MLRMGLKGIPRIISPQMLKILSEMGHGDEIGMNINRIINHII